MACSLRIMSTVQKLLLVPRGELGGPRKRRVDAPVGGGRVGVGVEGAGLIGTQTNPSEIRRVMKCLRPGSSRSEGSVGEAGTLAGRRHSWGGNVPGSWLWEVRARATPQPRDRQAGFWQQGSRMVLGDKHHTHRLRKVKEQGQWGLLESRAHVGR